MNIKRYLFKKGASEHLPVSGTFELTSRCCLSCEMCYIHDKAAGKEKRKQELSTGHWLSIGREAVEAGMIYLLLTGGEPMIREDFCELYTELSKMGILITINTNAVLVTEEIVRCLSEHPPERVNVSVYGASPETYRRMCNDKDGYRKTLRGIRMLKSAGIPLAINTTYTKTNSCDMEAVTAYAKEQKIPVRMASYIFPPVRTEMKNQAACYLTPEEYGKLSAAFDDLTMNEAQKAARKKTLRSLRQTSPEDYDERKRISACLAGRGAFWITWDGKMQPCGMLPSISRDLRKETFRIAWDSLEQAMDHTLLPSQCVQCSKKKICPMCAAVYESESKEEGLFQLCRYTDSYIASLSSAWGLDH